MQLFLFFFKLLNLTMSLLIGEFSTTTETYITVTDKSGISFSSQFVFLPCPAISKQCFILSLIQFSLYCYLLLQILLCIFHLKSNIISSSTSQIIQRCQSTLYQSTPSTSHIIIVQQFNSITFSIHTPTKLSIIIFSYSQCLFQFHILSTNFLAHLSFLHLGLSSRVDQCSFS